MSFLYNTFIYEPLYNGLMIILSIPYLDAGIAVILLTVIVKLILFPLSKKAVHAQARMKEIQPELEKIKVNLKDNKEAQAQAMLALYRDKKFNPFTSILLLFIQLPIIWALYSIFVRSGLPNVSSDILYSFVNIPIVDMHLFGFIDIAGKNIVFALLAGISQFFQLRYSLAQNSLNTDKNSAGMQVDIMKAMNSQMKYIFPVIAFVVSWSISSVIAIYWTVSNLFTLGQEIYIRKKMSESNSLKKF